jgi:hypothetical protein
MFTAVFDKLFLLPSEKNGPTSNATNCTTICLCRRDSFSGPSGGKTSSTPDQIRSAWHEKTKLLCGNKKSLCSHCGSHQHFLNSGRMSELQQIAMCVPYQLFVAGYPGRQSLLNLKYFLPLLNL